MRVTSFSYACSLTVSIALLAAACGEEDSVQPQNSTAGSAAVGAGGAGPIALVEVEAVEPGDDCTNGGQRIETGIDEDDDGELADDEVTGSEVICNGDDGDDGNDGNDGSDGVDGTDGTDGNDGVDGVDGTDGTDGTDGVPGTDGTDGSDGFNSLVKVSAEPGGVHCASGGQRIQTGLDNGDGGGTAGDGILQAGEVDSTSYVCETCPDSDEDGLCDAYDPCPKNARVAIWFPGNPGDDFRLPNFILDLSSGANVTSVTALDGTATPTLAELLDSYDAILFGSDGDFGDLDPNATGDLLAAYVDAGGVLLDAMFDHTDWTDGIDQEYLGGRWAADGYNAFIGAPQIDAYPGELSMVITAPTDPLVADINPTAFVADYRTQNHYYLASGPINTASPLGYVELAQWMYLGTPYPAILVSRHRDKRVLALSMAPLPTFETTNTNYSTRDFISCAVSQLVR